MSDDQKITITAANVLKEGESPFVLTARLKPVADLDRFQPAGFPEVGHVIYKAPRASGGSEYVCIVDSPASMANHLEAVCLRGAHDLDLVEELAGMPYLRCVTGKLDNQGKVTNKEVVVTSLTEGHRIASSYFLDGEQLKTDTSTATRVMKLRAEAKKVKADARALDADAKREREKEAKKKEEEAKKIEDEASFQVALISEFGIALPGGSKAHPPPERWWDVFKTIFRYDPNALVHGVLFPQWQIKIARMLTAHLEAMGASRVDRSGVKFDRLGRTTSGQPIFAVDDATAHEIRATFILDLSLVRSFGRNETQGKESLGLTEDQKEFLVALALWKIQQLVKNPFRFRSGCHLQCVSLKKGDEDVELDVDIGTSITKAKFDEPSTTDIYWPREELYREGKEDEEGAQAAEDEEGEQTNDEDND